MKKNLLILSILFLVSSCVTHPENGEVANVEPSQVIDQAAVRSGITSHTKEFKTCFDAFHKINPDLYGKMVVAFQLNDQGQVSNAEVDDRTSSLKNPELNLCILAKFKALKLPVTAKGTFATIRYPILFQAAQ